MATILELAQLSAAAYGDPIPPGWVKLTDSSSVFPDMVKDGYYGVAYEQVNAFGIPVVNPDGSLNIVIANKGTVPYHPFDLLHDIALTLHN